MLALDVLAAWAQIIAIPIAIIALLVSFWSYRRTRRRKALACEFHAILFPIEIKAGDALEGDVEIRYRGEAVPNLFVVRARLRNTGNVPILSSDIVEPVTFTFDPGVEILREPQILYSRPVNLNLGWHFLAIGQASKPRAVSLDFDLLNQDDEFVVEFMCTGDSTLPKVTARIQGITEIGLFDAQEMYLRGVTTKILRISVILLCLLTFVSFLILNILGWEGVVLGFVLSGLLGALIGLVMASVTLLTFGIPRLFQFFRRRRKKENKKTASMKTSSVVQ